MRLALRSAVGGGFFLIDDLFLSFFLSFPVSFPAEPAPRIRYCVTGANSRVAVPSLLKEAATMSAHTIRAVFDDKTIRVYQAYRPDIALPAVASGRFVPPFKMGRMTWIKPSFNWMMYRSGYAAKPGQEIVLGVDITREGFEWALANAALSTFTPDIHASYEAWRKEIASKPVRIQWDPERDWRLQPIEGMRTIQIGLSEEAVERYVYDWIVRIEDVTTIAHRMVGAANEPSFSPALQEMVYPIPQGLQIPNSV